MGLIFQKLRIGITATAKMLTDYFKCQTGEKCQKEKTKKEMMDIE